MQQLPSPTFKPTLLERFRKWRASREIAAARRNAGVWRRLMEKTDRGNRAMCEVFEMEAAQQNTYATLERKVRIAYLKHFLDPKDDALKGKYAAYGILLVMHMDLTRFSESDLSALDHKINHILWCMSLAEKTPDAERIIAEVQKVRDRIAAYAA